MPLVRINATGDQIALSDGPTPVGAHLAHVLRRVPAEAPIVILIHGFKFSPSRARRSPHAHILSLSPDTDCWKAVSWPRALGFTGDTPAEGLCIAFGWEAAGSIWRAYDAAETSGRALARLITTLRALRPNRGVDVVAHSLGGRVALSALHHLDAGDLRRAVLMTPAEMRSTAESALDTAAGQAAEFLNITSRENDFYDFLLEWSVAPMRRGDRTLSHSTAHPRDNWLDLQIDHQHLLEGLARQGHHIAPPQRRVCHWSPYLREGMFPFYRRFLREEVSLSSLRAAQPATQSPRWSRLLALPRTLPALPFSGRTAS